nr:uncharacterized protein LOC110372578 isoform X2 [Helicoverpa armigera]
MSRGDSLAPASLRGRQAISSPERRQSRAGIRSLRTMNIIHGIFVYMYVINICVHARGGHGGGHGGSHGHGGHGGHGGYHSHGSSHHYVTKSHTHYTYHPPNHIMFTCRTCSSTELYPVYRPLPPTYVYTYKDSDSRFRDVLTGLSLYNLGRSSATGSSYAHHYTPRSEEKCSLQIIERSHFEETEFPCFMISTFIETEPESTNTLNDPGQVDISSSKIDVEAFVKDQGPALKVTNDQECVLWHNLTMHKERNHVPCALLKEYADTVRQAGVPAYIWVPILLTIIISVYFCCLCYCKKKEKDKEKEAVNEVIPLNGLYVPEYRSN